mmetsp:Transcript_8014/g.16692  ORF Transcript_8014/g.16692 Transcript_8014/m.16692 type:complete len:116 (-) Transcript_8014:185-532(-)
MRLWTTLGVLVSSDGSITTGPAPQAEAHLPSSIATVSGERARSLAIAGRAPSATQPGERQTSSLRHADCFCAASRRTETARNGAMVLSVHLGGLRLRFGLKALVAYEYSGGSKSS